MYDRHAFDHLEFFMVVTIWASIHAMYIHICWFLHVSHVLIDECDRNVLFLWHLI